MSQGKKNRGGKHAAKPNRPQYTGKALVLHWIYIVITVISGIIVAAYVGVNLFSPPPDVTGGTDNTRPPQNTTILDDDGNEVAVEIPGLSADKKKQFYTFLLVGQDTYGGGNTDTMMLAAYDVPNQNLSIMSLPRDTFVNYGGRKVLLNSVYNRAGGGDEGIRALKREIGELTGVHPDFYVIVQWEAVGELVDAIDGVDFDVPRRMYYNDLSQNFKIDLQPGMQHLDGDKAMQLIRWRHDSDDSGHILNSGYVTGDLGRIQTQQDFLKAIIKKCLDPAVLLSNLVEYIEIFQANVVTDLSASNIAYFGKSAVGGLNMDNVTFVTLPYADAGDGAHLLPVGSRIVELVNERFNPYKEDIQLGELDLVTSIDIPRSTATPAPVSTRQPGTETPPPEETGAEGGDGRLTPPPTASGGQEVTPTEGPGAEPTPEPTPNATPTPTHGGPPEGIPIYTPAPAGNGQIGYLPAMPTPVQP